MPSLCLVIIFLMLKQCSHERRRTTSYFDILRPTRSVCVWIRILDARSTSWSQQVISLSSSSIHYSPLFHSQHSTKFPLTPFFPPFFGYLAEKYGMALVLGRTLLAHGLVQIKWDLSKSNLNLFVEFVLTNFFFLFSPLIFKNNNRLLPILTKCVNHSTLHPIRLFIRYTIRITLLFKQSFLRNFQVRYSTREKERKERRKGNEKKLKFEAEWKQVKRVSHSHPQCN